MTVPSFDPATIEAVCRILAETNTGFTGTQLGAMLAECGIDDPGAITKWRRLNAALMARQERDGCANNVVAFIQNAMKPVRYHDAPDRFEQSRHALNTVLAFEGLQLNEQGRFEVVNRSKTLADAARRATNLRERLVARGVHREVLTYCRSELLQDNYFHAVFEATKSVAAKIRDLTGLTGDGAGLVDDAFNFNGRVPHLALNFLQTDSEKSEQKGFVNLLKGLFGMFRNPHAHELRARWPIGEQDALDILSLVSLVHRRLDGATAPLRQSGV